MPTLTSVRLRPYIKIIPLERSSRGGRENLRPDTDDGIIPCNVSASKHYRCLGKSNDARNANTTLIFINHLFSITGAGKIVQDAQAEDQ